MENEKRFDAEDESIRDREKDKNYFFGRHTMCDLLNEQDEKIKELKSELNFKNNIIWDENDRAILCGDCYCLNNGVRKLLKDNRQFRQSQNSKAIEELEKLLDKYNFYQNSDNSTLVEPIPNDTMIPFYTYVLNQITELRGGDVEKA